MVKYVALMRGINVGGHRKIKMADLKVVVRDAGFEAVQTYVQSGNVVFGGAEKPVKEVAATLEAACKKVFGFPIEIIVRDKDTFRAEAEACPYASDTLEPTDGREPRFLHVAFLSATPDATRVLAVIDSYGGPEDTTLKGDALYIYYREGSGRSDFSKLLTEKKLGVSPTSRNWNTVLKLLDMLDA